jgi:hypothetical protein
LNAVFEAVIFMMCMKKNIKATMNLLSSEPDVKESRHRAGTGDDSSNAAELIKRPDLILWRRTGAPINVTFIANFIVFQTFAG